VDRNSAVRHGATSSLRLRTQIVAAIAPAICLAVLAASAAAGSPSRAARWNPGECQQVGRRGATTYLLCFRANHNEHGTFIAKRGSFERTLPVRNPGPTPTAKDAGRVGHWAWAALSPDGSTFLGQWSAECEVPIAFFAGLDGRRPRPVTAEHDWADSPTSIAYGWTTDGRAIVLLPREPCGGGATKPGLYLISRSGRRTLIHSSAPIRRSIRPRSASSIGHP
jgi:hypothetical protein